MERLAGALLESLHFRSAKPRIALLEGPRGVGKTFIAQQLQRRRGSQGVCASWDDWEFRKKALTSPYSIFEGHQTLLFKKVLALVDEFEKAHRKWDFLTDLYNAHSDKIDFIATSSYNSKLSLNNRKFIRSKCSRYRIHPFCLSELIKAGFLPSRDTCVKVLSTVLTSPPDPGRRGKNALELLIKFGGFPSAFICQNEKKHAGIIKERRDRLVREDLREMTRIHQLPGVESLMDMVSPGALLSFNTLRLRLGINAATARLWLDQLERLHFCFRVEPFAGRLPRALRHAAKLYLWDWSCVANAELRFENLIACALLRWCHFAQDWGGEDLELRFVRDKERRSVPFLLVLDGKPRLLVGTAAGEAGALGPLRYFSQRLRVPAVLAAAGCKAAAESTGVKVVPAAAFLAGIP
ncbi:MAG: AAA family ATPase [Elusimicrobia bacterium]|nr:AAA family ATPase [Elusimicrobiota bacterium]